MNPPSRLSYGIGLLGWKDYQRDMLAWKACRELARHEECIKHEEEYPRNPESWRKYVVRQKGL